MTEKSEVVNTQKTIVSNSLVKEWRLTKSGKAGIMEKESTDKEGSMKHNIILMVSLLAFILVSGQTVQAKDYIKILKEIKAKNNAIKTIRYLIKDSSSKKNFFLRQIENINRERRNELIKELLPFLKEKEAFNIIDEIEGDEQKESYDEVIDVLIEKAFNESGIKREKILEKLREIKEKILLKAECEQINFQRSEWDEGYEKWEKCDYVNAIPHFNAAIDENEAIIENPPVDWPSGATWGNKYIIKFAYWIIGTCHMFMENHDYVLARESFDKSINSYTEVMYATWTDLSYTYTGRTYQFENQHDTAISYFKKTSSYTGAGSEATAYWAESLVALGKEHYNEALEKINKVIADVDLENYEGSHLWPFGLETSYYNKAIIEIAYGNIEQARKDIEKGKVLLHYPGYTDDIGPMVKEYIKIYTKKFSEIENNLLISISPNPLYISLGEKATIQATINSANFKNPVFRTEASSVFSIGATTVTGNIAAAEVTSLATGNGNILLEVEIDGKVVSKKVEACVYEVKFLDKNGEELERISLCPTPRDFEHRKAPLISNETYRAIVSISEKQMILIYSEDRRTPMKKIILIQNGNNENIFENNELGYIVTVNPPPTLSKAARSKTFVITSQTSNITISLLNCSDNAREIYSNLTFKEDGNIPPRLPDGSMFRIILNGYSGINGSLINLKYSTDAEEGEMGFIYENNQYESGYLALVKGKYDDPKPDYIPEHVNVMHYSNKTLLTLLIKGNKFEITPAKGGYIGYANVDQYNTDTNPQAGDTFSNSLQSAISLLGYSVIEDKSLTKDEFLGRGENMNFGDIEKCSVAYIEGHGIYEQLKDKENYWGFECFARGKVKNIGDLFLTPNDFLNEQGQNIYNCKYDVALFNGCGTAKDEQLKFKDVINAKAYIGWSEAVALVRQSQRFPIQFFFACKEWDVHAAFKKAKDQLVYQLQYGPNPIPVLPNDDIFVDNNLKIFPEVSENEKIFINLYKMKKK